MGRQSLYAQRRDDVVAAIGTLTQRLGKPPSFREVGREIGISVATLHSYLRRLAEEGVIEWSERGHRTLKLTAASSHSPATPVQTPVQTPAEIDVGF